MKRFSVVALVGIGLLAGACASQMDGGTTSGMAKKSPYDRLGQKPAITAVVDDFVGNVAADPRINKRFANTNIPRLKTMLVDQICEATGGPCKYTGRSMLDTHRVRMTSRTPGHHGRRLAREERQRLLGVAQGRRALRASLGEVGLEDHPVLAVEGAEGVARGQRRVRVVVHQGRFATSRSRSSPRRIRVLTVPSGCLVRAAISDCVSPT